jgi:hypothetical protein
MKGAYPNEALLFILTIVLRKERKYDIVIDRFLT